MSSLGACWGPGGAKPSSLCLEKPELPTSGIDDHVMIYHLDLMIHTSGVVEVRDRLVAHGGRVL